MAALGYFPTLHTMNQVPQQHWRDPTLVLAFHIVGDILAKEDNDIIYKSDTRYFVSQVKRNLEKIIEKSKDQGTSSNRKTIIHAKEGLFSIKQIQKDLEDNDRSEGESDNPKQYTTEDDVFIETLRKPGKRRKWREIFGKGKVKGLFKSYKSSASLKSSYYNIQKLWPIISKVILPDNFSLHSHLHLRSSLPPQTAIFLLI